MIRNLVLFLKYKVNIFLLCCNSKNHRIDLLFFDVPSQIQELTSRISSKDYIERTKRTTCNQQSLQEVAYRLQMTQKKFQNQSHLNEMSIKTSSHFRLVLEDSVMTL